MRGWIGGDRGRAGRAFPSGRPGTPAAGGVGRDPATTDTRAMTTAGRLVAATLAAFALGIASPAPARGPGADGRFERRSSENFILYQDVDLGHRTGWRGSNQFEREVLASLESAHDALRDLLGVEPRQRVLVTIYDPAVFDSRYGGLTTFPVAGFYAGSIRIRGDTRLSSDLARVLHHEYVHAALESAAPSLALPALWNEGLAEWFARRALGEPIFDPGEGEFLASAGRGGEWIPLHALLVPSFAGLDPRSAALAYLESRAFVAFLARERGERTLRDLFRSLVRSRSFERALAKSTGDDLTGLEAALLRGLGVDRAGS
ncbi:hypothetical protein MYXO_00117 [Myxococcaceae bacterium]|nr:hypothetical protein MYXO_00117 [Myxococcaceae bacterium]